MSAQPARIPRDVVMAYSMRMARDAPRCKAVAGDIIRILVRRVQVGCRCVEWTVERGSNYSLMPECTDSSSHDWTGPSSAGTARATWQSAGRARLRQLICRNAEHGGERT